jgi:hypothetical protein
MTPPSLRMARAISCFVRSWIHEVPIVEQVLPSGHAQLTGHEEDENLCRDVPVEERWRELSGYSADLRILGRWLVPDFIFEHFSRLKA